MARVRDPNRDEAHEIYKVNSSIELVEIASQLNIPVGTIRSWKQRDKWDCNATDKKKCNVAKIKKNSVANKGIAKEVKTVLANKELTDKQKLFCLYYSKSFNATRSYHKAYECSYETALTNGPTLLGNTRVRALVMELKEQRYSQALLKPDDIFQKYMDIAFSDITDFLKFGREEVPVMSMFGPLIIKDEETGEKTAVTKIINSVKFRESSEVDGTLISEVKQGKDGASIKLHDRMKALDWLTEHMNMATEEQTLRVSKLKHEVSQLSGDGNKNEGISNFLKAIKPTKEDMDSLFADEVIDDGQEDKEE